MSLGHHGPSVSSDAVNATSDAPPLSVARRGCGVPDSSSVNTQFSPAANGATAVVDGFGPYVVHGPLTSASGLRMSGGCGSPKYSKARATT
jgi:hypothetical protein